MLRLTAAVLGLLTALPAHAGGFGVLATGGVHTERLWYHTDHVYGDGGAIEVNDPREFPKYELGQTLPHYGGGIELILGDRDDRFLGTFRWFYLGDAPQSDPAEITTEPKVQKEHVVADYRDTVRHSGVGMVGLSWGFVDIGDAMRFGVSAHVGSGFLTNDHSEYLAVDAGPALTWRASRTVMVFGEVPYQMRFRKGASHSVNLFVGARYMFD